MFFLHKYYIFYILFKIFILIYLLLLKNIYMYILWDFLSHVEAEESNNVSRRKNVNSDTGKWCLSFSFFSSITGSRNRRDLTRLACFSHVWRERFASFSIGIRGILAPNRTATCFILSASVLDITSLGIKSTAGRCRHSQYGSSRCGLVIARTRINVCPDDSAIWWSDSIIG